MPLICSRLSTEIKEGIMVKPLWLSTYHYPRLPYHIYAPTIRHPVYVYLEYLRFFGKYICVHGF